ncbi:MAG: hypothetical protein GY738_03610 [Pseudoalteromonas sp.]|nr:hypothetical protein [Pseudoalteromonas sp.]
MGNYIFVFGLILLLNIGGCAAGHEDYKKYLNMNIGENINNQKLSKSAKAGKLIRSDYLIGGEGLTKITTLDSGILRYHFSRQEVLPNYSIKDYVGKCLIYYDVDPKTDIILAWGFDKGGNPLSCRTWH